MNDRKKFTTTIDRKLMIEIKKKCIELEKDVNTVIEDLLRDWIKAKR